MTKKHGLTKGERFEQMEKRVKNLEMGVRVMQMVTQQLGNSVNPIQKDLAELASRQRDLQYRILAMQELSGVTIDAINARAEELQVKDFNGSSDKEDVEKGYTVADVVTDESLVILTTTAPDNKGFLRSKLLVKEIGFPKMREDLVGKTVGDTFTADINGVNHEVTVLGVRTVPPAPAEETATLHSLPAQESASNGAEAVQ
jgi:hypothetical protein